MKFVKSEKCIDCSKEDNNMLRPLNHFLSGGWIFEGLLDLLLYFEFEYRKRRSIKTNTNGKLKGNHVLLHKQ